MNSNIKKHTAAFPGKYIQAENLLSELPVYLKQFGDKALLIASPTVKNKLLPDYENIISNQNILIDEFQGECSEEKIARLERIIINNNINVIAGIGGGKTIDAARIAADITFRPFICVPTIASNDAPCSGIGVVYTEEGIFDYVFFTKSNPQVVLVDTEIIASAPPRFLAAGMGDALATWFEARSCDRTKSKNECGGYGTLTSLAIAKLCYDTLLKYGTQALKDNENKIVSPELNYIIEANILLSGIGFESGGIAAAHAIHNGLTALKENHSFYHGEKVAFGVLAGLHLNNETQEEIDTVYSFCEQVGLPTTFDDLGRAGISFY